MMVPRRTGTSERREDEPGGKRALANAACWPIVVRIDGDDPRDARILTRRQHQRERSADRDADDCRSPDIELVEIRRCPLIEILRRVCGVRDIRPAVPGIVKGMDGEVLFESRNDFLEYVELGSESVQEHEVRAHPGLDARMPPRSTNPLHAKRRRCLCDRTLLFAAAEHD